MNDKKVLPQKVQDLIEKSGGTIKDSGMLPDGSGFAVASFPLPVEHWLTKEGVNESPAPYRCGLGETRDRLSIDIRAAARYAIRASTMNGKESDFDPDAMVQNFIIGMIGYWTKDGHRHT